MDRHRLPIQYSSGSREDVSTLYKNNMYSRHHLKNIFQPHIQLKTIVLGIFVDKDNPNEMVESYTFNISYPNNGQVGPQIDLASNTTKSLLASVKPSAETIKKSSAQLMRTLVVLMQTLPVSSKILNLYSNLSHSQMNDT